MNLNSLPTEIRMQQKMLGRTQLNWQPQPGQYLEYEGQAYVVLERKHRYLFKRGKYHLVHMVVIVQAARMPTERSLVQGRWVIGDASCRLNAGSELLRCAVNPAGPCASCLWREIKSESLL
ncbi:MAG: DUF6464 family protein [Pseudanabaenaceae cyanobacterium bins.68]|nr:DUF6464 family protein [Pseudanabaenaceae cyanobacterium bins.68]